MSSRMTAFGVFRTGLRDHLRATPDPEAIAAVDELVPADRQELLSYLSRFTWLIVLSAGIAAFGLLANSSAVVIGAMLVAPLMTPITAAAAATVMARNVRLAESMAIIVWGTVVAIAVGFLIAVVAGTQLTAANELPPEITARTFPGLLDLGIAITAGAAAGYIVPRRSATGALPGVGIAVALVPPLAAVGITLQVGAAADAANAMLLYLTNLAAIILAASVMLILAGFRPDDRSRSYVRRLGVTVTVVVLVAVPLTLHTRDTVRDVALQRAVTNAVVAWDENARLVTLDADARGDTATVEMLVSGPNEPRPAWQLVAEIQDRLDGPVDLRLEYQRNTLLTASAR